MSFPTEKLVLTSSNIEIIIIKEETGGNQGNLSSLYDATWMRRSWPGPDSDNCLIDTDRRQDSDCRWLFELVTEGHVCLDF